jgi:hypothetical protein
MKNTFSLAILALLVATVPGRAEFEGVLEMKMSIADSAGASQGGGTMKVAVAKAGARSEANMQMAQMTMKMVTLFKNDEPNTLYLLNDASKTYSVMDLARMQAMTGSSQPEETYVVKKLGEEKLLGYKTVHVLVTGSNQSTNEMWNAKDFLDYETFSKLQSRAGKSAKSENLNKALKEAGAEGMPLKFVQLASDGTRTTMEVLKADRQSLPASTFEIPAGYTRSAGGMMNALSGPQADEMKAKMDEAKKRMDEAMKNMTPEQREMMEKMMKPHSGGNQ